jgi:hypothetical protein
MFKKLGLNRNHFLLALIPWVVAYASAPFVLFFAGHVFWVVSVAVLLICWFKKGREYAQKVLLALILLTALWYLASILLAQFHTGLYWAERFYLYNL